MANSGKFIDRNPTIRTAGLPSVLEMEKELLKEYHPSELLRYYHLWKCKYDLQNRPKEPCAKLVFYDNLDDIQSALGNRSRFVIFLAKFYEELFSKRAPLGHARPLGAKPKHVTNENTLFGIPSDRSSESVYDIILPPKSYNQVLKEYNDHHDWHIISHNAYYPGEQIRRKYNENFDRNRTMGKSEKIYWSGLKTKMALEECPHRTPITRVEYDYIQRTRPEIGKNRFRFKYTVPEDMVHGIQTYKDVCDAGAVLEEREPCPKDWKNFEAIAYIRRLRDELQGSRHHDIKLIYYNLKEFDTEKTGLLPISKLFEAVVSEKVFINKNIMMDALKHYELIEGESDQQGEETLVDWKKFWKLLDKNSCLPEVFTIGVIPDNFYNKDTTYRDMCKDLQKPIKESPEKVILKEDIETAYGCFSPSIPTQYSLDPIDFRIERSKADLQRIFSRLIPENFDEIWEAAISKFNPKCDLLSVNQLRDVYSEIRYARTKQQKGLIQ